MEEKISVKNTVLSTIGNYKDNISFEALTDITGLSFVELSTILGLLMKEGRIQINVRNIMANSNTYYKPRSKELFDKFMNLLLANLSQERNVGFYAGKLCITPKYLTAVVKEVSGKTPTDWIKEKMIEYIGYKLINTQMPIKEIAYEFNFSNQSFFGKYFKRNKGVSPGKYREIKIMENKIR